MKKYIIISFLLFCIFSCQSNKSKNKSNNKSFDIDQKNKLLQQFTTIEDSLIPQSQSAKFLIDNLQYHNSLSKKTDSILNLIFQELQEKRRSQNLKTREEIAALADSVFSIHSALKYETLQPDYVVLDSSIIMDNINQAISNMKGHPWLNSISFEDFSEYILPYKINDEPIDNWRERLYKHNQKLISKNPELNNINLLYQYHYANTYNSIRSTNHWSKLRRNYPINNYSWIKYMGEGGCESMCKLVIYNLRAIGIPATYDFIPDWGNRPFAVHSYVGLANKPQQLPKLIENTNEFNTLVDNLNTTMSSSSMPIFAVNDLPSSLSIQYIKTIPKVYRKTWSPQAEMQKFISKAPQNELYADWINSKMLDVTSQYIKTVNNIIVHKNIFKKNKVCYLSVFNINGWKPVAFSTFNYLGKAEFNHIGKNILYMPTAINKNQVESIGDPFIINNYGEKVSLSANFKKPTDLHLIRKFPLFAYSARYTEAFKGALVQASNKANFSDATNIFTFNNYPFYIQKIKFADNKKFQYIRIKSQNKLRLGTFEAFGINDEKLKGKVSRENGYLVLKLDAKELISKICIWPRNDENYIIPGNEYELFYWDEKWVSAGQKIATDYYLNYKEIPSETMYWLRCLTEGKEERIFTYENNTQIWW